MAEEINIKPLFVRYVSPSRDYFVYEVASIGGNSKNKSRFIMVFRNLPQMDDNKEYTATGEWVFHQKYGTQFSAVSLVEKEPENEGGMVRYLLSLKIRGLGEKTAEKIVGSFGRETLSIIDEHPEKLYAVPGLTQKKITGILDHWPQERRIRPLSLFLADLGVSTTFARPIYDLYKEKWRERIEQNPYDLYFHVSGIGFKRADDLALRIGIDRMSDTRVRGAIYYTLDIAVQKEGNCYLSLQQTIKKTRKILDDMDENRIIVNVHDMVEEGLLSYEDGRIYLPWLLRKEDELASIIRSIAWGGDCDESFTKEDVVNILASDAGQSEGFIYDETQAEAVYEACRCPISVITGGPGTGKTTISKKILAVHRAFTKDPRILACAPTGRAAKRLSETLQIEAKTIHRLLEYNPEENKFIKGSSREEMLEGTMLIIDEASMVDLVLMHALFRAIPPGMKVVIVGDVDQLSSIGAGNVLRDIIASEIPKVIRLKKIYRQGDGSGIVYGAKDINSGKVPDFAKMPDKSLNFFEFWDAENISEAICLTAEYMAQHKANFQVLTPMKRGTLGTQALNRKIQDIVNPDGYTVAVRNSSEATVEYRCHDRVMQTVNRYKKGVFNGDMGIILPGSTSSEIIVRFPDKEEDVTYMKNELDDLELAYAVTIHKSQGSEFDYVMVPVVKSHMILLMRNLIYTAVTRAKIRCDLLGEKEAMEYAVGNDKVVMRNSCLEQKLKGYCPRYDPQRNQSLLLKQECLLLSPDEDEIRDYILTSASDLIKEGVC